MSKSNMKRTFFYTVFSSFGGQVISILTGMLSVPLSLHYWGKDLYGIFTLINSIIIYLSISNLGLNSAANILIGKNNDIKVKRLILRRCIIMCIISVAIFAFIFIVVNAFTKSWIYLLGDIPDKYFKETYISLLYMVFFFLIGNVLGLVDSILYSSQKLYVQKNIDIFTSLFSFLCLLLTIYLKQDLVFFIIAINFVKIVSYLIKVIYIKLINNELLHTKDDSFAALELHEDASYKVIFFSGIKFFIIGIAAMVVWNTDSLVISHFMGVNYITPYAVTFKLFTIAFSIIFMISGAMMPILSKEIANQNWGVISSLYNGLMVFMAIIGGLLWIGGILFLKTIVHYWTGDSGYAGDLAVILLGGYAYLLTIINVNANTLGVFNFSGVVILSGWIEAIVNFCSSIFFLKYWGLGGVALGTFLGALVGPTLLLPYFIRIKTKDKIQFDSVYVLKHLLFIVAPFVILSMFLFNMKFGVMNHIVGGIVICLIYLSGSYLLIPIEYKNLIAFHLLKKVKT